MVTHLRFTAFLLVAALITACNAPTAEPQPTDTPVTLPTALPPTLEPTPTEVATLPPATPEPPTPTAESPAAIDPTLLGIVIYDSDLRNWPTLASEGPSGTANSQPTDAGYEVAVPRNWGHFAFAARLSEATFDARLTASPTACPTSQGGYGLIFHYVDATSYRYAIIRCDNTYLIFEARAPQGRTLSEGALPEGIDVTTGQHTIRVQVVGSDLTLIVDDREAARLPLTDAPAGDFAAYVRALNEGGVTAVFTRLEVAR